MDTSNPYGGQNNHTDEIKYIKHKNLNKFINPKGKYM